MAIGNPITLTNNVASKSISVTATADQTLFTVTGGYRINKLAVFRNGVRLTDGVDFLARDGASVTLTTAANLNDGIDFQVFDDFRVADAIGIDGGTSLGNVIVGTGITLFATSGIVSATSFFGDASNLTNLPSSGVGTTGSVNTSGIITATSFNTSSSTGISTVGILTAYGSITATTSLVGALTGNADTATTATNVTVADESSAATCFPLFTTSATGNLPPKSGTNLTFNSSTGALSATSLSIVGSGLTVSGVSTFFDDVTFTGAAANITFDKSANALIFADDAEAKFGDSHDLRIYHDGAHSIIRDVGTGDLRIAGNIVKLNNNDNTATMIKATEGSSVELNHNNSKKLETTSSGVIVTGIATATSFEGSGANLTNLPASGDSNDITACLFI